MPLNFRHRSQETENIYEKDAKTLWVPQSASLKKHGITMTAMRKYTQKDKFYPDWKIGESRKMFIKFTVGENQGRS